jgi:hypothetical protein
MTNLLRWLLSLVGITSDLPSQRFPSAPPAVYHATPLTAGRGGAGRRPR